MFGKRQETKELEEKLHKSQFRLEELTKKVQLAQNKGRELSPYFESQIAAQSEMDKQLTKVVGYAHQTIATSEESQRSLEQLAVDLTDIRALIEEEETTKKDLAEKIDNQNEEMLSIIEENRKNESPVKLLVQLQEGLEQDLSEIRTVVTSLQEFSKQMSVLCLNSAVEAGRLGEAGHSFIGAAEEVRQYSGEYEKAAEQASNQLNGLEERVRQISQQFEELKVWQEKEENALKQLTDRFAENEEVCVQLAEHRFSDKIYLLSSEMRLLTQNQEGIRDLQRNTLSEMENIGESFMDEQEARKELERVFDQITGELTLPD